MTVFLSECCDLVNVDSIATGSKGSVETNDKNVSKDKRSSYGSKTAMILFFMSGQYFRHSNIVFRRLSVVPFTPEILRPNAKPWIESKGPT